MAGKQRPTRIFNARGTRRSQARRHVCAEVRRHDVTRLVGQGFPKDFLNKNGLSFVEVFYDILSNSLLRQGGRAERIFIIY